MSDALPEGWVAAKFAELVANHDGRRIPLKSTERDRRPGKYPYYGASGIIDDIDDFLFDGEFLLVAEDGANLLSRSTPIAFRASGKFWVNNHAHVVTPYDGVDIGWVEHYLNCLDIAFCVTGTAQPKLTQSALNTISLLLAPSEEQRRVVAKVEDLLSKVHSSKKRLDRVSTILKRFRQSIVAAACAGQLTEDWRTRNLDSSNADVTVAGIRRRRESAAMTLAQKERIKAIYQEAEEQDSDTLPTNWRSVRLNKLCGSFDYGTSAKSQPSGKMPVLRMGNIQDGKIDWTDLVYTSNDYEIQSYALRPNTVLFNRTNSPELVGKTALYRGDRPAIFAGYLIRINNEPELDAEYLNLCLNTSYAREFCRSVKTDGVSQSNINAQKLGAFEVPFCPIEEQREIVARVKKLSGLADRLQARFENSRAQVDRLTQSILAKAFRGELVPTEAELARREGREYETAEQLLSRIGCATKACSSNDRSRRVTRAKRT